MGHRHRCAGVVSHLEEAGASGRVGAVVLAVAAGDVGREEAVLDAREVAVNHLGHVGEVLPQGLEAFAGQGHGLAPFGQVGLQRGDAAPLLVLGHRTALCNRGRIGEGRRASERGGS